jgi:quinol monooxygenase YgiN
MPIIRINEFHAADGKSAALREFLGTIIAQIEGAPGCSGCELLVDPADDARLAIVETWDDVAAHRAAAGRIPPEQFAVFRPLIAEPPRGRYYSRIS